MICDNRQQCAILPPEINRQPRRGQRLAAQLRNERRLRMRLSLNATMPRAWVQETCGCCYVHASKFCDIITGEAKPHNANRLGVLTTPEAVLTIVTLEVN